MRFLSVLGILGIWYTYTVLPVTCHSNVIKSVRSAIWKKKGLKGFLAWLSADRLCSSMYMAKQMLKQDSCTSRILKHGIFFQGVEMDSNVIFNAYTTQGHFLNRSCKCSRFASSSKYLSLPMIALSSKNCEENISHVWSRSKRGIWKVNVMLAFLCVCESASRIPPWIALDLLSIFPPKREETFPFLFPAWKSKVPRRKWDRKLVIFKICRKALLHQLALQASKQAGERRGRK